MLPRVCYILGLLLSYNYGFVQDNYVYRHYTQTDGLPSHTVLDVKQDTSGFIWLATSNGVSRFDGRNFVNYFVRDGLPDNDINQLFVDRQNRIWMLPYANAICYYKDGKIYNQKNDSALKKISIRAMPVKLVQDGQGNIAINTGQDITIISAGLKKLAVFEKKEHEEFFGIGLNQVNQIKFNVGNKNAVDYMDVYTYVPQSGLLKTNHQPTKFQQGSTSVIDAQLDLFTDGKYIVLNSFFDHSSWRIDQIQNLVTVDHIGKSLLSFNTAHGTYCYDYRKRTYTDSFLNHTYINRCIADRDGNYWFATPAEGLFFLSNRSVREIPDIANKRGGAYRFAYQNNLLYFLNFANQIKCINVQTKKIINPYDALDSNSRTMKFISEIDGNMYFQNSSTLFRFTANGKEQISDFLSVKNISGSSTNALLSTSNSVTEMNLIQKKIIKQIWNKRGNCAIRSGDKYYVGDLSGLYVLDSLLSETYLGAGIPVLQSKITQLTQGPDNTIWVGTAGMGIVCVRSDTMVAHFTEIDGLPGNNCNRLKTYGDSIWVCTDKGVGLLLYKNMHFTIEKQGLPFGLNPVSVYDIEVIGDNIFAATSQGIQLFENKKYPAAHSCKLLFTGIKSMSTNWPVDSKKIVLKSGEQNFIVSFTAISFSGSGITYHYKTDENADTWFETQDETLEFPNMSPGKYVLSIYAINNTGLRSNTIKINIVIHKQWYQQTGIIFLISAAMLLLFGLFIFYRIKKSNDKATAEAERKLLIASLEQKALRSQMNPHFIFNCLNAIKDFIYLNDIEKAEDFISLFSKLIRDTLHFSALKRISLFQEVGYLNNYLRLEEIRFSRQFTYSIKHDVMYEDEEVYLPPLLLQPVIENSIRHGLRHLTNRNGELLIHFTLQNNELICTIEDNGIGCVASAKINRLSDSTHESQGLELIRERIRSHNTVYENAIAFDMEDIVKDSIVCGTKAIFIFKQELI